MKTKGLILVFGVLLLGGGLLFFYLPRCSEGHPLIVEGDTPIPIPKATVTKVKATPLPQIEASAVNWEAIQSGQPAMHAPIKADLQAVPPYPEAVFLGEGHLSDVQELEVVNRLLELYIEAFGELPAGENNAQFMNALRGNNPTHLGLFPFEHARLDDEGQLLDGWGRPYFFHVISKEDAEVRSAGPDRILFTEDDLTLPPSPPARDLHLSL